MTRETHGLEQRQLPQFEQLAHCESVRKFARNGNWVNSSIEERPIHKYTLIMQVCRAEQTVSIVSVLKTLHLLHSASQVMEPCVQARRLVYKGRHTKSGM